MSCSLPTRADCAYAATAAATAATVFMSFLFDSAVRMSKKFCKLSQYCALLPKRALSSNAVSAVILRVPLMIAVMRLVGTLHDFASALADSFMGCMKSSRRISPGCTGRMPFFGAAILVVIDDFDIFGSFRSPLKTQPPLIIYSNRMLSASVAFKRF